LATTLTVEERTLEKLNPPTAVAGLAAELAYVTRYYEEDYDTGVRTEYGTPRVEVIWGVTVADKLAAGRQRNQRQRRMAGRQRHAVWHVAERPNLESLQHCQHTVERPDAEPESAEHDRHGHRLYSRLRNAG
jgi:hypothetical protein